MSTMSVADRIQKARMRLVLSYPFFATLALRLPMVEDASKGDTMCTDGRNIYYNPAFVESISDDELIGVIAHEALHPGFLHHTRMASRDHEKWNMAADYAINPIITEAGMFLPDGCLNDPQYSGLCAEDIYTRLPDNPSGGGGGGNSNQKWNIGGMIPPTNPDGSPLDKEEQESIERGWKEAMAQAAHIAKMQGRLPASLERLIDNLMQTSTNWREQLQSYLTEKKPADTSFSRPNRRYVASGIYLPSTVYEVTGELAIMIDTSGSIGQRELDIFGAEVNNIHHTIKPTKTIVIYCDAAVNRVDEFGEGDDVVLTLCGGGGTNFNPPFNWLRDRGITPHAAVYLTDGYGDFPDEQPYPVVWAINNTNVDPPFGQVVRIDE